MIKKLEAATMQALKSPEVQKALAAQGFSPMIGTAEEFDAFYRAERDKWAKVIQETREWTRTRPDSCRPTRPRGGLRRAGTAITLERNGLHRVVIGPLKALRGHDHGLDHPDPRRDLHRPRDQRLPAGRILIRSASPPEWASDRHRSRCGGGWRLSAMELQLRRLPARLGR